MPESSAPDDAAETRYVRDQPPPWDDSLPTVGFDEAGGGPRSIGPYLLLQKVGEGGMGEVWLAEQQQPVRRRVALKLIKAGMNRREVVARFASERQTLAVMNHPGIAQVFDAGSTPDGLPYFVMEYVPGLPITEYCDRRRLGVEERLKLFISVCDAVQHAHQKAIIHRDLKPSNILVREIDGKPCPKVIDFGVAKAVNRSLSGEALHTRVGALIGTPEYMSPEQAEGQGEDIDTRSDVYSLGIVLYELLVGAPPFDLKRLQQLAFDELLRRLREDDAPRPSTKFKTLGEGGTVAAQNRSTEPAVLRRQLRGDLDSITLKTIEKDRSRRYGSASDLGADIRRYLNDEPVLATDPSLAYRSGKFIRRHRWGVAASSLVALSLIALAVAMTIQSARIARERDRANREAKAAQEVADFLVGIFQVSDPEQARGNSITAREILDRAAGRINAGLAGQPELQARMMGTIGRVYEGLGLYAPAQQLLQKTVALRKQALGPDHRDTLTAQSLLARLEQYQGHYAAAQQILEPVYRAEMRVLGPNDAATLASGRNLGGLYFEQGRYPDAQKLLSDVMARSRETLGPEDPGTLDALHNLALTYDGLHLYPQEEALWRELAAAREKVLGADHPSTISSVQNLGYTLYREGKYAQAEELQRKSLELSRRIDGPDHPRTFLALGNLANTLKEEGKLAEAAKLSREVLAARERTLGPDNPETLFAVNNLADVLAAEGQYAEARQLLLRALEGERRVLGEHHPEVAYVFYNLSCVEARQGHRTEAFAALRSAVEHGYSDAAEIGADLSWAALRQDARYQELVGQMQAKTGAAQPASSK